MGRAGEKREGAAHLGLKVSNIFQMELGSNFERNSKYYHSDLFASYLKFMISKFLFHDFERNLKIECYMTFLGHGFFKPLAELNIT